MHLMGFLKLIGTLTNLHPICILKTFPGKSTTVPFLSKLNSLSNYKPTGFFVVF